MKQKENFEKARQKLSQFASKKNPSEIEMAGVIQAFEFTFEQAWKYFQKIAKEQGFEVNSPKSALQNALQLGFFPPEEEPIWAAMLKDRNLTSHTYHEDLALEIYKRVIDLYVPAFKKLPLK